MTDTLDVLNSLSLAKDGIEIAAWLIGQLRRRSERNTVDLLEAWRSERDAEIRRHMSESNETLDELRNQVAAMAQDGQFHRLQANLEFEALREATDERKRMLAHAAAALALPGRTINEKARIERALRQLDPEDVLFLEDVANFDDPAFVANERNSQPADYQRVWNNAKKRQEMTRNNPQARTGLTVAGCIVEDNGTHGGPTLELTPIGEHVLIVLSSFIKEKRRTRQEGMTA